MIHSLVAKACFPEVLKDVPVADIHKLYPKLRSKAKPVEFSQQFGGSANAIKNALGCTDKEAKIIAFNYNDGFKGIKTFKEIGSELVKSTGYIVICKYTGHKSYMARYDEWKELMEDEVFWRNYELTKDRMPWSSFSNTELYKTASDFRRMSSDWSRLALNYPTQGGHTRPNSLNSVNPEMGIPS